LKHGEGFHLKSRTRFCPLAILCVPSFLDSGMREVTLGTDSCARGALQPHDALAGQVLPSEIASRYEKCIVRPIPCIRVYVYLYINIYIYIYIYV